MISGKFCRLPVITLFSGESVICYHENCLSCLDRSCLAKNNNSAQIVQVERGQCSDSQQGDEEEKFLPPTQKSYPSKSASGSTDRYITVTPANKETNLYEDVQPRNGGMLACHALAP